MVRLGSDAHLGSDAASQSWSHLPRPVASANASVDAVLVDEKVAGEAGDAPEPASVAEAGAEPAAVAGVVEVEPATAAAAAAMAARRLATGAAAQQRTLHWQFSPCATVDCATATAACCENASPVGCGTASLVPMGTPVS
jgi:hypothetical protein